ncbi:MAG TPA: hypothetical protein PLQ65_09565 [Flavihumibacter sp.]|nr:hypothetical protein [Bacteroidota bacterium]HQD09900.1 hypothetical protein [Flavihumibacter sp.]
MKKLALVGLVLVSFVACMKTDSYPDNEEVLVNMNFVTVNTPDSTSVGDTVLAHVTITGSNTCTVFKGFNGTTSGADQYDIRAIGAVPAQNTAGCTDAVIAKDTFLTITPKAPAKLVFRFYNNETLFRADTVVVTP